MTRQDILASITDILRDVLDAPNLTLEESTHFLDVPGWDSLAFVTLMVTLETQFNARLDMTAMQAAHIVGEVITLMENERHVSTGE